MLKNKSDWKFRLLPNERGASFNEGGFYFSFTIFLSKPWGFHLFFCPGTKWSVGVDLGRCRRYATPRLHSKSWTVREGVAVGPYKMRGMF